VTLNLVIILIMTTFADTLIVRSGNGCLLGLYGFERQAITSAKRKKGTKQRTMFDFEKLEVYQVTQAQNISVLKFLKDQKDLDEDVKKLWKKASLSTVLGLAESTARMSANEKKALLTEARGAINECVAFLEMVREGKGIDSQLAESFYSKYEQMSKMMLGMIRSFSDK